MPLTSIPLFFPFLLAMQFRTIHKSNTRANFILANFDPRLRSIDRLRNRALFPIIPA